jgi:Ca2+-binding EF-hand superfamily protein
MMRLLTMLLVGVLALSVAGTTWAAEGAKKKEGEKKPEAKKVSLEDRFKKMDKDGDGKLNFDEFKGRATSPETIKEREEEFAKMDGDKDKAVTLDEMKAYWKEKAKAKKPAKVEKPAPKKEANP